MKNYRAKLTNKLVDECRSNPFTADGKPGKPYFVREETKPGLSLKVRQTWKDKLGEENQGTKTWIFSYRPRSSDNKNIKDFRLGSVINMNLAQAKKEVDKIKVKLAKGIEPSIEKQKLIDTEEVGQLIKKYYHNQLTTTNGLRPKTITAIKDSFRVWVYRKTKDMTCTSRFIYKDISRFKITKVNNELIREIHKAIGGGPYGAPYSANRFVAYLKMFFTWAIDNKYFEKENPCKIKKKHLFTEKRYNGRLSEKERENVYDQTILIDQRTNRLNYNQYEEKGLSPVAWLLIAFQLASGRRTK